MGLDRKLSASGEPKDKFLYAVILQTSVQSLKLCSAESLSPQLPETTGNLASMETVTSMLLKIISEYFSVLISYTALLWSGAVLARL